MKRLLICAALLTWSGLCSATVYKWVDAQGKTQYGDRPPIGVKAELVPLMGTHPPAVSSRTASPPASNAASNPPAPSSANDTDAKKAVQEDVEATRAKQCSEAQARYKRDIEGRRLYKEGKDGERIFLSSEEIDAERINAKRDVDAVCNSTT